LWNAGMTGGESKTKRWRITILDLLAFSLCVSLSLALMRASVTIQFVRNHTDTGMFFLGLFTLAASIGGLIGKFAMGTAKGAVTGCWYGCFALIAFGCVAGMIIANSK
jgi:hypothetical protein